MSNRKEEPKYASPALREDLITTLRYLSNATYDLRHHMSERCGEALWELFGFDVKMEDHITHLEEVITSIKQTEIDGRVVPTPFRSMVNPARSG